VASKGASPRARVGFTYPMGVYSFQPMTIDKWIVLVVAVALIIALNVNFIRRMNRRGRDDKQD